MYPKPRDLGSIVNIRSCRMYIINSIETVIESFRHVCPKDALMGSRVDAASRESGESGVLCESSACEGR